MTAGPVRLPAPRRPFKCNVCPPATKEACGWYGCPFDTALDAPGLVMGRPESLVAARIGATGRA